MPDDRWFEKTIAEVTIETARFSGDVYLTITKESNIGEVEQTLVTDMPAEYARILAKQLVRAADVAEGKV